MFTWTSLDASSGDKAALFQQKLRGCIEVYDFSNDTYAREKHTKRLALMEIAEYIQQTKKALPEVVAAIFILWYLLIDP